MNEPIKVIEYKGYKIDLYYDDNPEDPRGVLGYMIDDEREEGLPLVDDGCWGYYSEEDLLEDAKSDIDRHLVELQKHQQSR